MRRRWGRLLVILAIVLAGLYVTADLVALQLVEARASNELAQALAAERVRVHLGGFPFLPGLAGGRIREVEIEADGVTGGGLRIARMQASVDHVRFQAGEVLRLVRSQHAPRTRVSGQQPFGRAEVVEADLLAFLRTRRQFVRNVRIIPEGVEVTFELTPGEVTPPVRYYPRLIEGKLSMRIVTLPEGLPRPVEDEARLIEQTIDIPRLPQGLTTDVRVGPGSFVLEASGPTLDVLVGEGGLRSVEAGQRPMEAGQRSMEAGQRSMEAGQRSVEADAS